MIDVITRALARKSRVTVSGLGTLGLDKLTVKERVPQGTLIGNVTGQTAGSTVRIFSPVEYRFQLNGNRLEAGPWLLDTGSAAVILEETISTVLGSIVRQTTLNVTVTRDTVNWPAVTPTVWVAPTAQGTGDGLTAANAKSIWSVAGTLVPGDIVGVRADLGTYTFLPSPAPNTTITLSSSGTAANHIKWICVDATGKRTLPTITGCRFPYRKQTRDQEEVLNLTTLADSFLQGINIFNVGDISYVDFEDFAFQDVQVAFNQVNGTNPHHLTFTRTHGHNFQRIYEHAATNGHSNCSWFNTVGFGFSKAVIRARGTTTNAIINGGYCDSQRQDNDQWASGSQIDNTASNIAVSNFTILNSHNNQGSGYANGDGFSTEEQNPGCTFTNVTTRGHTDAGLDLKSSASIIGIIVGDCKRNLKFWNGEFHVQDPVFSAPRKRGIGSGSACHLNNNQNIAGKCPHVRVVNGDLRLFGQASAYEIDFDSGLAGNAGAVVKYINCLRDAVPALNNSGPHIRFMIAAIAPTGNITLTSSAANVIDGTGTAIPISTNRDASFGGVIIRSIGGADAALFQINGLGGVGKHGQSISPVSPIAWTNTAADTKNITLTLEDIAGNQLVNVPFTVTIQQDTVDHRVLDFTAAGADNTNVMTDVSPSAHPLSPGTGAKIRITIDPTGSLRVNFATNGTGTNRVTSVDSPDWLLDGTATIIAKGVNMDVAATGLVQQVLCQWNNTTGGRSWRLYFDAAGKPTFEISADGNATAFLLADPTARNNATNYDLKVTREFVTGTTYLWKLWVNGVVVASVSNTVVPKDVAQVLAIGATSSSRDYMAGYIKAVKIYKGTASGA